MPVAFFVRRHFNQHNNPILPVTLFSFEQCSASKTTLVDQALGVEPFTYAGLVRKGENVALEHIVFLQSQDSLSGRLLGYPP
jgi:hypothetical protein